MIFEIVFFGLFYFIYSFMPFRWSWLADGTVRFPMQQERAGCGPRGIAGTTTPKPTYKKYDTFCYKNDAAGSN